MPNEESSQCRFACVCGLRRHTHITSMDLVSGFEIVNEERERKKSDRKRNYPQTHCEKKL